jgi:tryptophan synthase alpha chain
VTHGRRAVRPAPTNLVDDRSTGIDTLAARLVPGRPAVVCYVPLGDPLLDPTTMLDAYADAGVDVLEVGIPTPHPWLDGPEVSDSMARALDSGVDAAWVGHLLGEWRAARVARGQATPAVLWFGYPDMPLGPIRVAAGTGAIDALLLIDAHRHPEGGSLDQALMAMGVARCAFLPWEPTPDDLRSAATATGYVMVQARPGITGVGGIPGDPRHLVRLARETASGRPVVTGFGVGDPDDVVRVLDAGVDGVVVGSACIRALREGGAEGLRGFLGPIVAAARTIPARRA